MYTGGGGGGGGGGANPEDNEDFLEYGGSDDQNHHDLSRGHHHQSLNLSSVVVKITLLFVVIELFFFAINQSSYPTQLFQRSFSFSSSSNDIKRENPSSQFHEFASHEEDNLPSYSNEEMNDLESILKKAAMEDKKTVIVTTLNAAWTEPNSIFDLFLESFRVGNQTQNLLNHVVVAALDQTAYSRCLALHLHCFPLTTAGIDFSGEAFFMSEDYLKMVWRKIDFQRVVLELGYDFVFSDADVMWLRDPFQRFYPDVDFQIACDHYLFNSTDYRNSPNSGLLYVRSNNRTIKFYKFWYRGKDYFPGQHDQEVLNHIRMNPYVINIGMEMRFLDTAYFGGFCEPSKDLDLVLTMHANCCIGLDNKIHDIKMAIDDWKKYMALPSGVERNLSGRSWTVPRICG